MTAFAETAPINGEEFFQEELMENEILPNDIEVEDIPDATEIIPRSPGA